MATGFLLFFVTFSFLFPWRDEYPHDEYRRLHHDDFSGPPRGHYPHPYEFEHWQSGEDFKEHHRGQRLQQFSDRPTPESQFAGGSDVAAGNKRPNSISLPQASSIDLASASLPPREYLQPVFELGRRGDSAENQFEARAGQDIALPVPGAMSLGHFETREGKGTETNESGVQDMHAVETGMAGWLKEVMLDNEMRTSPSENVKSLRDNDTNSFRPGN
ncbi:hypothetical protein EDB84DRAFT_1564664 [Lactarius hengduanensis]|nr:hypothetical protein EDB84DRAFT_1564664 [Lactarius hengduanensis]